MQHYSKINIHQRDITYWETGQGEKPLLLLHTLRTQIEYTERVVALLQDQYRIIVPDLPGFGRSSKELHQPYDATLFAETIQALINQLALKQLTIAGESIGASIALYLAAEMPNTISSVFAFNPHDSMGALIGGPVGKIVSFVGKYSAAPFKKDNPALFKFILQAGFANHKNLPDAFVEKLMTVPTQDKNFAQVMKSLMQNAASWPLMADMQYPRISDRIATTVIYGDQDWSPRDALKQNQKRLPFHVNFKIMPNTGHFSFLDNPKAVAEIILAK